MPVSFEGKVLVSYRIDLVQERFDEMTQGGQYGVSLLHEEIIVNLGLSYLLSFI